MSQPEVEFVDELPDRGGGITWSTRLQPLLKKPNVWALVYLADKPDSAYSMQGNLHRRIVAIPEPEHEWEFAARGCEVYAIYRGMRGKSGSLRRANRKR